MKSIVLELSCLPKQKSLLQGKVYLRHKIPPLIF